MHAHHYLLLHSAVIEREGCAVIMPAPPGSGKSTLCAGLVHRGWRLLSDELALISLTDTSITPLGRPISLKNQSIDVIKEYVPGAIFNRVTHDTSKGLSLIHISLLVSRRAIGPAAFVFFKLLNKHKFLNGFQFGIIIACYLPTIDSYIGKTLPMGFDPEKESICCLLYTSWQ